MEFINIEGEKGPHIIYKPFIYSNIVECSNHFTIFCPNGEIKVIKKKKEGNDIMERIEILKVSSKSNPNSVAGAIAAMVKEYGKVELQAIGAGALNQAIKGIAIARGFVAPGGINLVCVPAFADVEVEGEDRTGIKLIVKGE